MKRIKTFAFILISAVAVLPVAAESVDANALSVLQKENSELRDKLQDQSRELALMRMWLAGVTSGEAELGKDAGSIKLLRLKSITEQGMDLALKSDSISKEFRALLQKIKLDEATRINYILKLDEFDNAIRSFTGSVRSSEPSALDMRVISVNTKLNVAVVSGGMNNGIFSGMMLYPANYRNSQLQFRVVSVRPGTCAVDLKNGSWSEVVPGMALTPFRKK